MGHTLVRTKQRSSIALNVVVTFWCDMRARVTINLAPMLMLAVLVQHHALAALCKHEQPLTHVCLYCDALSFTPFAPQFEARNTRVRSVE